MASETQIHVSLRALLIVTMSSTILLQIACGSGSGSNNSSASGNNAVTLPSIPAISSTPVQAASEGTAYSYQLTAIDPSGGPVSFALTTAPSGATLSGNTVSWTPTAAQSRVPNNFTVTATTSSGGSATQSWTIAPAGTVRVTWLDNFWTQSGSTSAPYNWGRVLPFVMALVPQADGSFQSLPGSLVNGTVEISNVPAGDYWLQVSPVEAYWTSSSAFDLGRDYPATNSSPAPGNSTTTLTFAVTGLEPTIDSSWAQVLLPGGPLFHIDGATSPGSTTWTGGALINSNVDFSTVTNAFVLQFEPAALGPFNGFVLGPELSLTNLSLTSGTQNTVNAALNPPVSASLGLAIKASEWAPLLDRVAPSAPSTEGGTFGASIQPYATDHLVTGAQQINLIWSPSPAYPGPAFLPETCSTSSSWANNSGPPTLPPALLTDFDAGAIQYNDPFPLSWVRSFTVIQCAAVSIALPDSTSTQAFILSNSQSTALPTAAITPLISPVQNPKINGSDLFAPTTVNSSAVTLSWSAPSVGTPTGYQVQILTPVTLNSGASAYSLSATLRTRETSITVPPSFLLPNKTYLFEISAIVNGLANAETSPHRSALPIANADVISSPITIGAAQ